MKNVHLLHFNDFHRRLTPCEDGLGGAARLATLIQEQCEAYPDALVLNGGDVAGDNTVPGPDAFQPLPDIFNRMGVDVLGLGNHEFEDPSGRYATLREGLIDDLKADVVCANVTEQATGQPLPGTRPYVIKQLQGVNVAVIGAVTRDLANRMFPAAGAGLSVAPIEDTLKALVPKVRAEGAEVVVVMGHEGLNEMRAIARKVDGIDVMLAAHDHRQTERPVSETTPNGGTTAVAEAGGYGRYLGHITIGYDPEKRQVALVRGELLAIGDDIVPDPVVRDIVARYEPGERSLAPPRKKWRNVSLEQIAEEMRG
ncbi:MAG: hypothetical protein FJX76_15375 [Armatimonadetes bacterium]|nr:hypothetical protein [Armatimonadota bacterium]